MPQLIIKWGNRETRFAMTTSSIDIGRSDDNLLQIRDVKVSRYQCKIVQTPVGFLLSDSQSSNGTFLNGKRVERNLLRNSDVIKIGNVEIIFSENDSAQAEDKGPVIISSGQPSDDASVGEVTTVISIQEENAAPASNGARQSRNGTVQVAAAGKVSNGAVAVAQIVKRAEPAGKPQNGGAKPVNVAVAVIAKPVVAQKVMNNQVLPNGSGRPTGTPPPAGSQNNRMAQPARPMAPKPAPRVPPPAPKPQSGPISRLGQSAPKPPPAPASRLPFNKGKPARTAPGASGRLKQEKTDDGQPKPKKKNMLYIIGGAVLILIVIIAFVVSSGSNKKAETDNKLEIEALSAANKLYDGKEYGVALKKYEAFLEEYKESKYSADVKERIKKIKERDEKDKESKPRLAELKKKKKDYPTSKYPELLKEFDSFIKEYEDISPALMQDAKGERDTIKRVVGSSGENEVNILFNKALSEANNLRDKKDYDGALAKLKSFLKENQSLNNRQENTIRNEIKAIEKEKEEKSEKK
ncbi:MAG: FHA domain-containing protein [Planctomycetes bacterium]|nr:FHA domain-containing protein [Planctomycetota bacterium]